MKATTMSKTWKQLFFVFAFLFTESQGQNKSSCSSSEFSFDKIHKQLQSYWGYCQKNCSFPAVPRDGGLLCASAENNIYCKPMCNAGYDFNFLRRSRLFEKCGAASQHKWTTQYIGGNTLADCTKSHIAVAGAPSAFFPEGMDCHKTKSDEQLIKNIKSIFHSELIKAGITSFELSCLICGQNQI